MTVSRRGFLGLVGGFAAVSALPGHGGVGRPAAREKFWIHSRVRDGLGNILSQTKREVTETEAIAMETFIYGLPYWQVTRNEPYLGIERSAHPVFPPEKRFRK